MHLVKKAPLFSNALYASVVHHHPMKRLLQNLISGFRKRLSDRKLVGQVCAVTSRVQPGLVGEIRLKKKMNGKQLWPAESKHRVVMGNLVKVVSVKGNTLIVERFNDK